MTSSRRHLLPAAVLLLLTLIMFGPWTPQVQGQDSDLSGSPQAECGPGSQPEGAIQGRVPAEDYESGRTDRPYTCNAELLGRYGDSGGYKVHRYVDAQGQECAFYDSTLLFPQDILSQASEGAGVVVLDMSNPADPQMTAQLTTPAMLSPHESLELNQERGLLAAVAGNPSTFVGVVDVYDVSQDCTQPALQASAPVGFLGHESGFAPDGMTFYTAATSADSIVAIDLTDPTAPTPIAYIPMQSHGIQVSQDGNRLYTTPLDTQDPTPVLPSGGGVGAGIAILDVSAIQAREPLPSAELISDLTWPEASIPQSAIPVTIDGAPYLVEIDEFVAFDDAANAIDGTPGAGRIIDISDETAPQVVSKFRLGVHDPEVRQSDAGLEDDPGFSFLQGYAGHYCAVPRRDDPQIVACSMILSGLRVFDITDPANPVEIAYFNNVGEGGESPYAMSAPSFVPERNEIWYSDGNSGFYAVRLTNDVWGSGATGSGGVDRLSGPTRIETAVAASVDTFAAGSAGAVVLARADEFADALAGGPLAVQDDGPILLSGRDRLHPATAAEISRVLGGPGQVVVLGGEAALGQQVVADLEEQGHTVIRLGGTNRFDTARIVAESGLLNPAHVVVVDGGTFADAVVASPVAAHRGGALLLSAGGSLPPETADYLSEHGDLPVTSIGPRAVNAVGARASERIDGTTSGDLSVDVAGAVFPGASQVGIARGDDFADALTAGAVLGRSPAGPVLLVRTDVIPDPVRALLSQSASSIQRAVIFGGTSAVGPDVATEVARLLAR